MRLSRKLALLSSAVLFSTASLQAVDLDEQDIESLRDWINSKRMITVRELGGQLSISGDVHAELQSASVVKNGKLQRGRGTEKPNNQYDVEFNLLIDYRTARSWLAARLRFDNDAGVLNDTFGSGKSDKIRLERAYWGYRLLDGDRHTMDIDVGRRGPMVGMFDSRLQFVSNFDGVLFKDNYAVDNVGDLYYQIGVFLINERKDQGAFATETGIMNIANTGFYAKYSFIDWDTKDGGKCASRFKFIVSQMTLGYKWIPQPLDRPVIIYLAGLYNHRAKPVRFSDGKKANFGGYLGFSVGSPKLAGDWSLDINYQVLAAQCVPDFDVSGIGIGSDSGFYCHRGEPVTKKNDAEGNVNYRGFELTFNYLISNNLMMFQQWKQSITLDNHIGPFRRYKQYEVDFIYSF
jgi:hypothetical protein